MEINMNEDYWAEYYRLKRLIESGKAKPEDYPAFRKAFYLAREKSEVVQNNFRMLTES